MNVVLLHGLHGPHKVSESAPDGVNLILVHFLSPINECEDERDYRAHK